MAGLERSVPLTGKFTPDEAREVRKFGGDQGMSVSECVRAATLAYMALCGNRLAVRLVLRGVVRVGADVGESIMSVLRRRGHDVPTAP